LLIHVRKRLRQTHGFPRGEKRKFGVPCVYLPQPPEAVPQIEPPVDDSSCGTQGRRSCNDGLGTACFVTGTFGLFAAAEVVKLLIARR
jgi:tRNA A37 threonylcarbamoyladenosine dehydratase